MEALTDRNNVVVRISRGWYAPEDADHISAILSESEATLRPAITRLDGLLEYYAGVDDTHHCMTNTSIWRDLAAAEQMATLPEMLAQRKVFEAKNVRFDPISNFRMLWVIDE